MDKIKTVLGRSIWEQLIDGGKQAQAAGNTGEAATFFKNAADVVARVDAKDPRRAVSLRYLGSVYHAAGRSEEAGRAFATALEVIEACTAADLRELNLLLADYSQVLANLGHADQVAAIKTRLECVIKRQSRPHDL